MKKGIYTIILIVVFVGLLILAGVIINKQENENQESSSTSKKIAAIEVTEETFEKEIDTDKKVLIDFYATWCGPCKTLSPVLEEVAGEHDEIKLIKIDVDKNPELSEKFQITAMPTLVVLQNGEEINRSVGAIPKSRVVNLIK